jgi:hypothetical protein
MLHIPGIDVTDFKKQLLISRLHAYHYRGKLKCNNLLHFLFSLPNRA